MKKKILINAKHPEEKRVAIVEGDTLVDFYVEVSAKEHLKGNIYKGVVARIEPGLQAAFVDFGARRHGFLQMREINPEYLGKIGGGKRPRIQEVLSKGQELVVQVEKDERDTKGASLTTYLSIPGRYIVMMPGEERVGISRKIEDREARERLKEIFSSLRLPEKMGFILRTAGSDRTSEELENDLKYLVKLWNKIQTESRKVAAPALIYKEQDIAVRTVRDYLTGDVTEVLVDDQEAYRRMKEFLRKTLPWRRINIKLYKDKKPIFSKHNIEEQIAKIYERYVYLPSKGYIVIDKTEALTAIDVNSGRSRKEESVESTALRTNIEAADEIARQFRLRDIGGLIVIDFIDMASHKNRREVENRLRTALSSDKAHIDMTGISRFGLVEMTRERLRPAYMETVHRKCDVCGGTGIVRTDEVTALSAYREIHARLSTGGIRSVHCSLPVGSLNCLINTKRSDIADLEKEFKVAIRLSADAGLAPGRYEISVEKVEEEKPADEEAKRPPQKAEHKVQRRAAEKEEPEPSVKVEEGAEMPEEQGQAEQKAKKRQKRRPWPRRRSRGKRAESAPAGGVPGPDEATGKSVKEETAEGQPE